MPNDEGHAGWVCPRCGGTGRRRDTSAGELDGMIEKLRAQCSEFGISITFGNRVKEANLAKILDRAVNTLRNRRYSDCPIPFKKVHGRVYYDLRDVAQYLLERDF
jgi:hypothetical protein